MIFCRSTPWKHAWPQSLNQPSPPTLMLLMTRTKPRQSCTFRRRPRQQKRHGSKQSEDCRGLASQTRQYQPSNTPAPPRPRMKTAMTWNSQTPKEPTLWAAAPSATFTASRSDSTQASEEHTLLQRSLAAGCEDGRLVPHACARSVLTPHDHITNVQKSLGNSVDRIRRGPSVRLLLGPTVGTWRDLQHRRSYTGGHNACVHAVVCGLKLAAPGISTEPRGFTASQSRPADILTTAAVPGRGVALDACVASPNAAAARGDAAQASFDRKLSHYRDEISFEKKGYDSIMLRVQGDELFRDSQLAIGWTEEHRPYLDSLMAIDFSCIASLKERQRYANNYSLGVNDQGPKPGPRKKRAGFPPALNKLLYLKKQVENPKPFIPENLGFRQRPIAERERLEQQWKRWGGTIGLNLLLLLQLGGRHKNGKNKYFFGVVKESQRFSFQGVSLAGDSDGVSKQDSAPRALITCHTQLFLSCARGSINMFEVFC